MIDVQAIREATLSAKGFGYIQVDRATMHMICNEIDRLLAEVKSARMEGWKSAKSQSIELCAGYSHAQWQLYKYGNGPERANPHYQGLSMGADECEQAIDEMQPPAEWSEE